MTRIYTGVFQCIDGWWIGWTEDLPGATAQARTLEAAREDLREAILLLLETLRAHASEDLAAGAEVIREEITISIP